MIFEAPSEDSRLTDSLKAGRQYLQLKAANKHSFMKHKGLELFKSIEICAGGGGQALGLESAGFDHIALVENDSRCCETLRQNRPKWTVVECDVRDFSAKAFEDIDLLAGGVPCPPFSKAGKQLGRQDERDLFPEALRLVEECMPKTVMLENVKGFLDPKFQEYRGWLQKKLLNIGYRCDFRLLNACDFGVSQLRPRVVIIAVRKDITGDFEWPDSHKNPPITVGKLLLEQMSSNGWIEAKQWAKAANKIAPTIVGGSKKHGGPDLGPTRAKRAWAELGVDGLGIANEPPEKDFRGMPKLTVNMVAMIQGFSQDWKFSGKKTASYRQVGNAFPPPVARAVGLKLFKLLQSNDSSLKKESIIQISPSRSEFSLNLV